MPIGPRSTEDRIAWEILRDLEEFSKKQDKIMSEEQVDLADGFGEDGPSEPRGATGGQQ